MLSKFTRFPTLFVRCGRSLYTATASLPTPEWSFADLDSVRNVYSKVKGNPLRDSTAAVASRLSQQTQFPLLPGTPFSLEGALNANPLCLPRVIAAQDQSAAALYSNEEWAQMRGYSLQELKGKSAIDAIVSEWTDRGTIKKMKEAFSKGTRFRGTIMTSKKDGTPFMMHVQITPLLSKIGESSYSLAVLQTLA